LLADLRAELPVAGVHLVLYGERGVGKSSLWNVLLTDRKVEQHSASSSDDLVSIFLRALEALGEQFTVEERTRLSEVSSSIGKEGVASVGSKLSEEATEKPIEERRLDLNFVLDRIAARSKSLDAVVIDEFQNLSKQAVQTQIIEVVKGFADRGLNLKILLVGVADTDDELVPAPEYAQYKGRHFVARRVPRMSDEEVRDILDRREERFHVHFDDHVQDGIVRIARGYPATAHRLALASAQAWVRRAALGHTANFLLRIASVLPGLEILSAVSVKKAGVDVERRDLERGVTSFVERFREHHPAVAARYDLVLDSDSVAEINQVLSTLAVSPTTKMNLEQLALNAGLTLPRLEALLNGEANGLVEVVNGSVCLAVRDLPSFAEASRYLAARDPDGAKAAS
jgi:Holliday junction resolvasome RuvABC ATP-dependent DNA helicase subunit